MYHANTLQTQASLNPFVWILSTKRYGRSPHVKSIHPPSVPACLSEMVWFIGQAQSAGVRASGENATHLCHFFIPPAVFTHLMCNQLDVWPLGITCQHMDSLWTAGKRLIAWHTPLEAQGHVNFTCRSHGPCMSLAPVQLHQQPHETGSSGRARSRLLFFFLLAQIQHTLLVSGRFSSHLPWMHTYTVLCCY